jgi:hypothetical protein
MLPASGDQSLRLAPCSPFIFKEGIAEQSYMIHIIGEAEKARIVADQKTLLNDLCSYRDVLCLLKDESVTGTQSQDTEHDPEIQI